MLTVASMNDEEVYRSYSEELTRYATGLVGPADAGDVVTDAWLKATRSRNWAAVENQKAFLYRSVFSVANDHHRKTLSRRLRELKTAVPHYAEDPAIDLDVLRAVGTLSLQQRSAVMLTYWGDLAPEQVAERMGISTGSVKKHLARARKRLKERLS